MSSPYEDGNAEASSSSLAINPLAGRLPLQPLASHSHPDEGEHDFTEEQVDEYREQDRFLPIANVARIMRESLPASAKIAKESKECLQECVSEFISFITSEASERCKIEKRKTMNGEDILDAMQALGFDNYVEALKVYLAKYRISQVNKPKRSAKAGKSKAQLSSAEGSTVGAGVKQEDGEDEEDDESESSEDDDQAPWGTVAGVLDLSEEAAGTSAGERDSKRAKLE